MKLIRSQEFAIVSAAWYEADATVSALKAASIHHVQCELGVGSIKAAKNAAAVAEKCRGKNVIFIGTCGIFAEFSSVKIVRGSTVEWLPACVRNGFAYSVPSEQGPFNLPLPLQTFVDLQPVNVICSSSISLSPVPTPARPILCVENLELFSCYEELSTSGNSLTVLLGITNRIGPNAHPQWTANHKIAADQCANLIIRALTTLDEPVI